MPLSFKSENHGNIAFGYFNIESDMLLLEKHFFFADMFSEWMSELADQKDLESKKFSRQVYSIADPENIGDLMGAIHAVSYTGFIGEVYKLFPFPEEDEDFKQNPDGFNTQKIVRTKIEPFSDMIDLSIVFNENGKIHIGPYVFEKKVFHELIQYVEKGGYPEWKDQVRPKYVIGMKDHIQNSCNTFFQGVFS
jgi:hypothetical protein